MSMVVVCDRGRQTYAYTRRLVLCVCGSRSMSLSQLHTCSVSVYGSGLHGSSWTRIELANTYTHSVASVFGVHMAPAVVRPVVAHGFTPSFDGELSTDEKHGRLAWRRQRPNGLTSRWRQPVIGGYGLARSVGRLEAPPLARESGASARKHFRT